MHREDTQDAQAPAHAGHAVQPKLVPRALAHPCHVLGSVPALSSPGLPAPGFRDTIEQVCVNNDFLEKPQHHQNKHRTEPPATETPGTGSWREATGSDPAYGHVLLGWRLLQALLPLHVLHAWSQPHKHRWMGQHLHPRMLKQPPWGAAPTATGRWDGGVLHSASTQGGPTAALSPRLCPALGAIPQPEGANSRMWMMGRFLPCSRMPAACLWPPSIPAQHPTMGPSVPSPLLGPPPPACVQQSSSRSHWDVLHPSRMDQPQAWH